MPESLVMKAHGSQLRAGGDWAAVILHEVELQGLPLDLSDTHTKHNWQLRPKFILCCREWKKAFWKTSALSVCHDLMGS